MTITGARSGRFRRLALTLALTATFALVTIVAGHGVAPLGYLMVRGWSAWTAPDLLAWVAVALLASGAFVAPGRPVGQGLLGLGALASIASWLLFVRRSELLALTLASSLPYLVCLAACARQIRQGAPDGASSLRAAPSEAEKPSV